MNVWITGSAGFLGTRLARYLERNGHKVVGLSRRQSAPNAIAIDLSAPNVPAHIREIVAAHGRPDVVVHAASKQPGAGSLADYARSNVTTTLNLVEGLASSPPSQLIFTSTLSVYPPNISLPARESTPAVAAHPYAATKRWAEEVLESWSDAAAVTLLRLPSLYGVGQADSFIDGLARTALRNEPLELFSRGELIRDALHVDDVVVAIGSCINRPSKTQCRVMNLGCGRPVRTKEYANELVAALSSKSEIVPVDRVASQYDMWADITLAGEQIGFHPTELRESLITYANELRA